VILSESHKEELQKLHSSIAFMLADSSIDENLRVNLERFTHYLDSCLYRPKIPAKPVWMS